MGDFWVDRGLLPGGEPEGPSITVGLALPTDYQARLDALQLAVTHTMSLHDGGKDRTIERAQAFHAFLMGVSNEG